MNCKWFWTLALVLILGFSTVVDGIRIRPIRPPPRRPPSKRPPRGSCNVRQNLRKDCGYPGISRAVCQNRGCCFSSRFRNAPWCYYRR